MCSRSRLRGLTIATLTTDFECFTSAIEHSVWRNPGVSSPLAPRRTHSRSARVSQVATLAEVETAMQGDLRSTCRAEEEARTERPLGPLLVTSGPGSRESPLRQRPTSGDKQERVARLSRGGGHAGAFHRIRRAMSSVGLRPERNRLPVKFRRGRRRSNASRSSSLR